MNQMVATNVKQLVLTQGTFGPQEIHQITEALTEDSQNHRALREAVNEMEASEDRSPAAAVRLGVCQYLLGRYNLAYDTLKTGDGGALAHFYMGKTYVALEEYDTGRCKATPPPPRRATMPTSVRLARVDVLRVSGHSEGCVGRARQAVTERWSKRPNISISGPRPWPPWAATRPKSIALFERAVEADPQAFRGAVRPGHGKRSPRQRRNRLGSLRALGCPLPGSSRLAAEPGHLVRRPAAIRTGPAMLLSEFWIRFPAIRGLGCSSKTRKPRATCSTTKTPSAAAIG